jgi:chaperone modulatory protein CbpM
MSQAIIVGSVCLGEDTWLALEEFSRACGVERAYVEELMIEGLVTPSRREPELGFGGAELARVRRILRLQRDFEAGLASVAVMLDLIDEVDRLRGLLRRAGLPEE